MQLDLRQIAERGCDTLTVSAEQLVEWSDALSVQPQGAGLAELDYQRQGSGLRVTGSLSANLSAPCARCGVSIVEPIEVSIAATFVSETSSVKDDLRNDDGLSGCMLEAEAMEEVHIDGQVIDLRPWLRDEWRLGVPLALRCLDDLCREAAASSQKKTVDPRWAGLAALRDTLPGGE